MCDPDYACKVKTEEAHTDPACKAPVWTRDANATSTALTSCQLGEDVHLQTFRSWIIGPSDARYIRGILDGGSQRTFLKEDLVEKLGLKVVGETSLAVNSLAPAVPSKERRHKIVEVRLRSQFDDSEHVVRAIVVRTICPNVPNTDMNSYFVKHLRKLGYRLLKNVWFPKNVRAKEWTYL